VTNKKQNYKHMKIVLMILLCLAAVFQDFNLDKSQLFKEWEKMHDTKTTLYKDYNDLKFGMFIHWGAYSTLGGIWKGKQIPGLGEWIMYEAQIPRKDYKEVCKKFNPTGFNAEEWVKLAKEAGMKYIVAMTKHHDGFSMYRSKVTDFNISDYTPFKRDPIEEIYQACQKYDIRLGLYYSHSIDWMDGGDAGAAQYKKEHLDYIDEYASNQFDPSPVSFGDYIEKKAKPQMREILKKFPNLIEIWYDYPVKMNLQQSFDFYRLAHEYQPRCLVNSRVGNNLGDINTAGDNEIPADNGSDTKPFETPGTLNDTWGYKSYDNHWKSHKEMLLWIVEIASKGGNYLLNVGPDGNGIIPEESVKILKEVGAWMRINGDAIYGTHCWTTRKEGPTKTGINGRGEDGNIRTESGQKISFDFSFTPEDFWFTARENYVYVISLTTPVNEKIRVKSLFDYRRKIKSIQVLGDEGSLKWQVSDNEVDIILPLKRKAKESGFVLKIEL